MTWLFKGHTSNDTSSSLLDEALRELRTIDDLGLTMEHAPDDADNARAARHVQEATFGSILFDRQHNDVAGAFAVTYGRGPKFACVSECKTDEQAHKLFRLLDEGWKLRRPTVLLSVTGSARNLILEPRLEHQLKDALEHLASCSGGWIITGGTDSGVMALVGQALRGRLLHGADSEGSAPEHAPIIGIAPYGAVSKRDLLYNSKLQNNLPRIRQDSFKANLTHPVSSDHEGIKSAEEKHANAVAEGEAVLSACRVRYTRGLTHSDADDAALLEPGHTHFLLVDNGKQGECAWYGEVKTRALLEDRICEQYRIASVQLVVQGGYGTFMTVKEALERGCQVLVVEDSSGAAQIIAELINPMLEEASSLPKEDFFRDRRVRRRVEEFRADCHLESFLHGVCLTSEQVEEVWKSLQAICKHLEQITTFSFRTQVANAANRTRGSVQRPFEHVVLDVIVKSAKLESTKEALTEARRLRHLKEMRPTTLPLHVKSRGPHPAYTRQPVPDHLVQWSAPWKEYSPQYFESDAVRNAPAWADPLDPTKIREQLMNERVTCANELAPMHPGETIKPKPLHGIQFDSGGRPINPRGRTGLSGRGMLGKWGPNYAVDIIVTRFEPVKEAPDGTMPEARLQMVAVQRLDTLEWAIPGGFISAHAETLGPEKLCAEMKECYVRKAAGKIDPTTASRSLEEETPGGPAHPLHAEVNRKDVLDQVFRSKYTTIFSGYVDDPRNTDNAWVETTVLHFRCTGRQGTALQPSAGADVNVAKAMWLSVDADSEPKYTNLYASHRIIVDRVARALHGFNTTARHPEENDKRLEADASWMASSEGEEGTGDYRMPSPGHNAAVISPWAYEPRAYEPLDFSYSEGNEPREEWCDPPFEEMDQGELIQRLTHEGPVCFDPRDGRPLNPRGRTGLRGRGLLGKWGPNLKSKSKE